jgi:hypothetical protein
MFVSVEILYGTQERGKGKENDRASVILHTIDMKVEDIRMCTENCQKIGLGGKGVRESIRRDSTDQSKTHPHPVGKH